MNSTRRYILDDKGEPVPVEDLLAWVVVFENSNRVVKQEKVFPSFISTVFLALDHQYSPDGPPILWETLVFGGPMDGEMNRCSGSREQAIAMHAEMVKQVKAGRTFKAMLKWATFRPFIFVREKYRHFRFMRSFKNRKV